MLDVTFSHGAAFIVLRPQFSHWGIQDTSQVKSKYFYSLKVKYNMTSEEMEIQSCSQDGNRNFIYIITGVRTRTHSKNYCNSLQ